MQRYVYSSVNVEMSLLIVTRFGTPLVNETWGTSVKVPWCLDILADVGLGSRGPSV